MVDSIIVIGILSLLAILLFLWSVHLTYERRSNKVYMGLDERYARRLMNLLSKRHDTWSPPEDSEDV